MVKPFEAKRAVEECILGRGALVVLAILLVAGFAAAGLVVATPIVAPPIPEQLVEGHTVWATIEILNIQTQEARYAAAVAVLVRERVQKVEVDRFPGVLWFNDQYLIEPTQSRKVTPSERFPCTGAVIAVNQGDPVVDMDMQGRWTLANPTYVESYFITDPNEHAWIVDLWNTTWGRPAWTVAILNNQAGSGIPDNDKNCGAYNDNVACTAADTPAAGQQCSPGMSVPVRGDIDPRHKNPGDNGRGYPCTGCSAIKYNALLYFRLEHLTEAGQEKNHTEGTGDDWVFDVSGCHQSTSNSWRCPNGDDDAEGNSHPYNPDFPVGLYDGRNNHGGSDECGGVYAYCHATRDVDIYFGYVPAPIARTFYVTDVMGADAPYHCHETNPICAPGDFEDDG